VRCPGSGAKSAHLRHAAKQILGGLPRNAFVQQRCAAAAGSPSGTRKLGSSQAPQVPVRPSAALLCARPRPCPTETSSARQRTAQQLAHTPFEVAVHACTQKGSERAWAVALLAPAAAKVRLRSTPPLPGSDDVQLTHKNPQNHHQSRHWKRPFSGFFFSLLS
jgi:hypothetical protein